MINNAIRLGEKSCTPQKNAYEKKKVNETGKEIFNTILVKNVKYRRFEKRLHLPDRQIYNFKENRESRVYI